MEQADTCSVLGQSSAFRRRISYAVEPIEGVFNFIIKLRSLVNSASHPLEPVNVSVLYVILYGGCSCVDLFSK